MQIVIDIDEEYYELLKNDVERGNDYKPIVIIANGTPLPKGHGICKFEKTRYRSIDQTGESYDDGVGWRCSVCCNVWKDEHVSPRWRYCPKCISRIIIPAEEHECDRNICTRNEYNGIGCDKCVCRESPSIYPNSAEEVEE